MVSAETRRVVDHYPAQLAAERGRIIERLRAALRDFESWTGYPLPAEIRRDLRPGDLVDFEEVDCD